MREFIHAGIYIFIAEDDVMFSWYAPLGATLPNILAPSMDYARRYISDGYVFVPQRGLQDCLVFYRSYDRTVSDPKPYADPVRQAVVSYAVGEATCLRIDTEQATH